MSQTCEGPAPARTGLAENATSRKPLDGDSTAGDDDSAPMDQAAARRLTTHIQLRLETITNNVEQVIPLIEQAKNGKIFESLGYRSWTAYVSEEFGGQLARLAVAERRPVVEILADTGMSTRAIAPIVGVSPATIARDLVEVSHRETPAVVGIPEDELDGVLRMADATEETFEKALSEAREDGDLSAENLVSKLRSREVTGTDGKIYSVPPPAPPQRRRPLPDAYFKAVYDLEKVLGRLARLHGDNRFLGNQERIRLAHRPTIERLAEVLLKIEDELEEDRGRGANLAIPQSPRYGPRRKHLQMLEAMTTTLSGLTGAVDEITELDNSVNLTDRSRISRDLGQQIQSLLRLQGLLDGEAR